MKKEFYFLGVLLFFVSFGTLKAQEISNLQLSNVTCTASACSVTVTWDGTSNANTWVYVHELNSTGSKHSATDNSYTYSSFGSDYTFTVYVEAGGTKLEKVFDTAIPTVSAGPDQSSVEVGTTVSINGSATDLHGDIISYEWTEEGTVLSTNPSFSYSVETVGNHTLTLTVTDDDGATESDYMFVATVGSGVSSGGTGAGYDAMETPADPVPTGTIYYFADDGDDSNDGLSKSNPKKTLDEMRTVLGNLNAGDAILFAMGDVFTYSNEVHYSHHTDPVWNVKGTASNPIIIGRYWKDGEESETALPILSGEGKVTPSFTHVSGDKWKTSFDNVGGWLQVDGVFKLGVQKSKQNIFNDYTEVDFAHLADGMWYRSTTDPNGSVFKHGFQHNVIHIDGASYIIINGIDVRWARLESIYLKNADHITVQNSNFSKYNQRGLYIWGNSTTKGEGHLIQHNNLKSGWTLDYHFLPANYKIYYVGGPYDDGHKHGVYISSSDDVPLHDRIVFLDNSKDVVVKYNTFTNIGHGGVQFIELKNDGVTVCENNKVIHNKFYSPYSPYARPISAFGYNKNLEIAYNFIETCNTRSQVGGHDTHIHHNIWKNIGNSTQPSGGAFNSFVGTGQAYVPYGKLSGMPTQYRAKRHIVEHNIFYNFENVPLYFYDRDNLKIRNNIFYNVATNTQREADKGIAIITAASSLSAASLTVDNNLFYSSAKSNYSVLARVKDYSVYEQKTVSELNGFSSSKFSSSSNIEGNPNFIDTNEFRVTDSSPAYNAGTTPLATKDWDDVTIAPPYDIGLYNVNATLLRETATKTKEIVYPNPTSGIIYLDLGKNYETVEIAIMDARGQRITNIEENNTALICVDMTPYIAGIYFMHISVDGKIKSIKFIKR